MTTISDEEAAAIVACLSGKLNAAAAFLRGKLKKGSVDENEAKRSLAGLLREGPLPSALRQLLADMIDPDIRESMDHQFELTKIHRRGRPRGDDRRIAAVVWDWVEAGYQKQAAHQHAVDTLKCSYSAAEKAFARHRKHFKALKDWGASETPFFKKMTRTTK